LWSGLLCINCGEISVGDKNGSIILDEAGYHAVYESISGDEYDVHRSLSMINGSPAIVVLGPS
jgi:hypothetical protein